MSFLLLWAATTIHREKFDAIKRSIVAGTSKCFCSWGCPQGALPGLSIGRDLMTSDELWCYLATAELPEADDENEHTDQKRKEEVFCRTCTTSIVKSNAWFFVKCFTTFFFDVCGFQRSKSLYDKGPNAVATEQPITHQERRIEVLFCN